MSVLAFTKLDGEPQKLMECLIKTQLLACLPRAFFPPPSIKPNLSGEPFYAQERSRIDRGLAVGEDPLNKPFQVELVLDEVPSANQHRDLNWFHLKLNEDEMTRF